MLFGIGITAINHISEVSAVFHTMFIPKLLTIDQPPLRRQIPRVVILLTTLCATIGPRLRIAGGQLNGLPIIEGQAAAVDDDRGVTRLEISTSAPSLVAPSSGLFSFVIAWLL